MKKSVVNLDQLEILQLKSEIKAREQMLHIGIGKSYEEKVEYAKNKIIEFHDGCKANNLPEPVVSFSGGRDSSVLLHLVRTLYPETVGITATELFNPDNAKIIANTENLQVFPGKMGFDEIIKTVGYPMVSKELSQKINGTRTCKKNGAGIKQNLGLKNSRAKITKKGLHLIDTELTPYNVTNRCCDLLKGGVKHDKRPVYIGTTIFESTLRQKNGIEKGCNVFENDHPRSRPLSIGKTEDIERYCQDNTVQVSKAYEKGGKRTGCMFCGFGLNMESAIAKKTGTKNRLELVMEHYPSTYNKYMYELGMGRMFADSYCLVPSDEKYCSLYEQRQLLIKDGYKNFSKNLDKILNQIETRTKMAFTDDEILAIHKVYEK